MIRLERVTDALPPGLEALRHEARGEGYRMLDRLVAEWADGTQRFAGYVGDAFAGIGGLTLELAIPGALRMRRFYVAPAHRRAGIGRGLAAALLDSARGRIVTVNAAAGSEVFWQALGFVPDRRDGYTHTLPR